MVKKGNNIGIISAVFVVIFLTGYFILGGETTESAILVVDSELVQVDFGSGFQDISGESTLKVNDVVRTKDGEATIILYDSIIISLSQNTEVEISDLTKKYPKVKQTSGSTWSKFTNLVGIESFDVETPTTIATVRGTEFGVTVEEDTIVVVGEGEVDVVANGRRVTLREFEVTTVAERVARRVFADRDSDFDVAAAPAAYDVAYEAEEPAELEVREITDAEKREILARMTRTSDRIRKIREERVVDETR